MICVAQQCVAPPPSKPDASTPPDKSTESTPDATSEATPEATPEPPAETTPESPAGDCKSGEARPCDGGCGKGTQTCTDQAKWGPCWPDSKTKSCYTGDSATENKGICKAGTQTCGEASDGTLSWGSCEGEVLPQKEVCNDQKDNDCNGKTDESEAGCLCKPSDTQKCGPSDGECQQGTQTCKSDNTWGDCVGAVGPTKELCDDKDNDCNGKIDETFSKKGQVCSAGIGECKNEGKYICSKDNTGVLCDAQPGKVTVEDCNGKDDDCDGQVDESLKRDCYTGKAGCQQTSGKYSCKGTCSAGFNTCNNGTWSTACQGETTPEPEICRDQKDNDCDGLTDETCGTSLLGVTIKSDGSIIKNHAQSYKTKSTRKGKGFYTLYYSTTRSCADYPLLLTAHTFVNKPIAYTCNGHLYEIRMGAFNTTSGALEDNDFSAVLPPLVRGEVWGVVDARSCATTGAKCKLLRSYGGSTAKHVGKGVFEIAHSACNVITRPAFVTLYDTDVTGYATIAPGGNNLCRVYTYNLKGAPSDRSFSFWLPQPDKHAWASVSISLGIVAQNNFKDQQIKWSGKRDTRNPNLFDITYGSFANPSAVLVSPQAIRTPYSTVAGFTTAVKQGVRISSFQIGVPPAGKAVNFSVMFVQ